MTSVVIDDVLPRTQAIATASQTVFNTLWTVDSITDVVVYAREEGVEANDAAQLVDPADYTVTLVGASETVRVTFSVGRTENDIITIIRDTPTDRDNIYTNTNFTPSMLNGDFGRVVLNMQQNELDRDASNGIGVRYNYSETVDHPTDQILARLGAGQIWQKNLANSKIEAVDISSVPDFFYITPVLAASTDDFDSTYDNGIAGEGATLTANSNGVASLDGVALALNDRVLFKNQDNNFENGIYFVSDEGSGATPAVYTRATDFDEAVEVAPGTVVTVLEGSANGNSAWLQTAQVATIGTDAIIFVAFVTNNPGGGYTWIEVTDTAYQIIINTGFIPNNASLVTLTLPAACIIGDSFQIQGKGAGLWRLAQNAGQTIHFGNVSTTTGVGGYIEATHRYDSFEVVCITANTEFAVVGGAQGNLTIV